MIFCLVNYWKIVAEIKDRPTIMDDGMIGMAVPQGTGIPLWAEGLPNLMAAVDEIAFIRQLSPINIMINTLGPKTHCPIHTDTLSPTPLQPRNSPHIERWHLPIQANDYCFWWDERDGMKWLQQGFWYGPMPYWLKHTVSNNGDETRINIIVDLDTSEYL